MRFQAWVCFPARHFLASISIVVFVFLFVLFAHGCNCRLELICVERIFTQLEVMLHGQRDRFSINLDAFKAATCGRC
uniref:Putative secreted protein n=1 Tax=Ixodes ricinus TaxID=34613 RepID=A0A6B0TUI9_IXORI